MGVMAKHILQGERPLVYYGQDYMGVIEAYIGAFFMAFMGNSVFALRMGMIIIFAAFIVALYAMSQLIYTKNFALMVTALFCFCSTAMLTRQLVATGGYLEVDVFAVLAFALAVWLALTPIEGDRRHHVKRHLAFFFWTAVLMLGLYSHPTILPWMLCISIFLLIFCWREIIFKGGILSLLAGLLIGGLPLIIYNIGAGSGHHTIGVLLRQVGHPLLTASNVYHQITNTFSISVPIITGDPICHLSEFSPQMYWGFNSSNHWNYYCSNTGLLWSSGFLMLGFVATIIGIFFAGNALFSWRKNHQLTLEDHHILVRNCAHLLLLLGLAGTLIPYMRSQPVLDAPGMNSRYLIGLWIGLPAIVWPLWVGATYVRQQAINMERVLAIALRASCIASLILLLAIGTYGNYQALSQTPEAYAVEQNTLDDINVLRTHGVTHIYGDYWLIYKLVFYSDEKIQGVADLFNYKQSHTLTYSHNRYMPYYNTVVHDPYASYVVGNGQKGMSQFIVKYLKAHNIKYQTFQLVDGFTVYQPLQPIPSSIGTFSS